MKNDSKGKVLEVEDKLLKLMMKNDIRVEELYKEFNRYRTLNSLNKQVLVCITLETMRLVFNQYRIE